MRKRERERERVEQEKVKANWIKLIAYVFEYTHNIKKHTSINQCKILPNWIATDFIFSTHTHINIYIHTFLACGIEGAKKINKYLTRHCEKMKSNGDELRQ